MDKCKYCPIKENIVCFAQKGPYPMICKRIEEERKSSNSFKPQHNMLKRQEEIKNSNNEENNQLDPSLIQKTINFTKSTTKFINNWVSTGEIPLVSQEIHDYRLSICEDCEIFDKTRKVCRHMNCGCNMENKTWLASERCPLNPPKWDVAIATERKG